MVEGGVMNYAEMGWILMKIVSTEGGEGKCWSSKNNLKEYRLLHDNNDIVKGAEYADRIRSIFRRANFDLFTINRFQY